MVSQVGGEHCTQNLPLQSCSGSGPKRSWVHRGCKRKLRWLPTARTTLQLNGVRQKRVWVVQPKGRTATTTTGYMTHYYYYH